MKGNAGDKNPDTKDIRPKQEKSQFAKDLNAGVVSSIVLVLAMLVYWFF